MSTPRTLVCKEQAKTQTFRGEARGSGSTWRDVAAAKQQHATKPGQNAALRTPEFDFQPEELCGDTTAFPVPLHSWLLHSCQGGSHTGLIWSSRINPASNWRHAGNLSHCLFNVLDPVPAGCSPCTGHHASSQGTVPGPQENHGVRCCPGRESCPIC